jgi:hypothetical protein
MLEARDKSRQREMVIEVNYKKEIARVSLLHPTIHATGQKCILPKNVCFGRMVSPPQRAVSIIEAAHKVPDHTPERCVRQQTPSQQGKETDEWLLLC